MKACFFAVLLCAPLVSAQSLCGFYSGDTLTQIESLVTSASPCILDSTTGLTLYGPFTLVQSVVPNVVGNRITADDITVNFIDEFTSPHTVGIEFLCSACSVNYQQSSQFFLAFYVAGTFTNFGVLLTSHSYGPLIDESSMPSAVLQAQLGAGGNPGYQVIALNTYLFLQPENWYAGTYTAGLPAGVSLLQTLAGFNASGGASYASTVYFSQPLP